MLELPAVLQFSQEDFRAMILYDKLWLLMETKGMTYYKLEHYYNFSSKTLKALKNNQAVSTQTLNKLCYVLNCSISDIVEFQQDPDEKATLNLWFKKPLK